jgi:ATP-binding cassette, subfamily B, bacterial PglK
MFDIYKNLKIFFLSDRDLKFTSAKIIAVFSISSIFELLGIMTLGPLIFLATSGEESLSHPYVSLIFNFFNFHSFSIFFLYSFLFTFSAILMGSLISMYSVMLLSRIATKSGVVLGDKLLRHYLFLSWMDINAKSANHIINEIYQESSRVTQNIFVPLLMIHKFIILTFLTTLGLFFIDPVLTLYFFFALGLTYVIIYLTLRSRLYKNSEMLTFAHEARLSYLSNVFDLIKQIKIWRNENYFGDGFHKASQAWGDAYRQNLNVALLPRYAVEALILLGASIVIFVTFSSGIDTSSALPKLSIFLFSSFKILPALQGIYYSSSQIRGNIFSLEQIIKTLTSIHKLKEKKSNSKIEKISSIRFQDISFSFNDKNNFSLKNISLELKANNIIGVIGKSGAGKSTFCDIMMGFIKADKGKILINNKEVDVFENIEWFKKLSYAPPVPKLIEDNLEQNIYFQSHNVHDFDFLDQLINLDFLEEEGLKNSSEQYNFSAGEMQRIGLARALARKQPELIILDEPTSALDNINRSLFLEKLQSYKKDKIIILITHDLELLKILDQIIVFEDGSINTFNDVNAAIRQSSELNQLLNV